MSRPNFRVVSESTAETASYKFFQGTMEPTGIVDSQGRQYFVSADTSGPTVGGSGGPPSFFGHEDIKTPFEKLKQNVDWINSILGGAILLSISAFVGIFFILDDRIGDRFTNGDDKISDLTAQVSEVRIKIAEQDGKLENILKNVSERTEQEKR